MSDRPIAVTLDTPSDSHFIPALLTVHVRRLMIGTDPRSHSEACHRLIVPFQDPQTNLHLFSRLLEAILLTIEPRLVDDPDDNTYIT